MRTFYALRYVDGTPLSDRKHEQTLGRFDTWLEADDARTSKPQAVHRVEHWDRLAERVEAGEHLDGRASIYTAETYAEARDRWDAYRGLLVEHLRGQDGGGQ